MNEPTHVLAIDPEGRLSFVYADDLAGLCDLGPADVRRASHVEPADGADGMFGGWTADLSPVGGPALGPFADRGAAVAAEVEWLQANYLMADARRKPVAGNGPSVR